MNYYTWLETGGLYKNVFDEGKELPPGMSIEEHRKHCEADKRKCPYEQELDNVDEIGKSNSRQAGSSSSPSKSPEEVVALYDKEGVSPRVAEEAEKLYKDLATGKRKAFMLPAEVFRNEDVNKLPKWMLLAYITAAGSLDDMDKAEQIIYDYAKEAGAYIDDIDSFFKKGYGVEKHIGNGMEASVYHDKDDKVAKQSSLGVGSDDVLTKLERLMLSNMYFPETAYEVFGLGTDSDGKMSFALKQKEIKMSGEALTDEEIETWLKEKGWKMKDSWLRNYISGDEMLACMDMHNENVVKDKDGNIVCIDACVIPNSYPAGMKGNYTCDKPPEHFNVKA